MLKINYMSTLFVGIDVSSKSNVVCAIDFYKNPLIKSTVTNNQPGAYSLICQLLDVFHKHTDLNTVVIALESTSIYSLHIANYLSSCEELMPYHPYVFCLNPKMTANYRKSFIGMNKTDLLDAFVIADFARVGRIETDPWRGSQFLALQRLTRHRLHLVEALTREKTYMVSNMFLKFSELPILPKEEQPFCDNYGSTAASVLTEFFSMEDIINASPEELISFLGEKSRNRIENLEGTASLLQKAARDSYRLDKCLYEPLNISLACSFNCIDAFKQEIKIIDKAIEKSIAGLNPNAYTILMSIDGIGPVFASGILAEIGDISGFHSQDALAKYAGLTWTRAQSGEFEADESRMTKAGNRYLRYYLGEAANSMKNHSSEYRNFYYKKYNEVPKHKHKRALTLTSRKLVRLIFGLLTKEKLYSTDKADALS
ncbi:transposase IS116/IS110/IS902 family protein [Kineothrix alysoides]|uniref:Transposase IS116/IS110/IS902 family protein n=1 Tax=Kineothrix alysoides TaxID=1469948 RepID=A0A4R1QS04_9FIRM|nr:IS110 family transposase [Kineothrix alysoides]TCL53614.1 transposase IS116/IS110/IS902 family protein [Kineothrix alysoides]